MERHAAETYAAVLRRSQPARALQAGHGNAIALPYHHTILPLSSRRDKETEVRWGSPTSAGALGAERRGLVA